MIMGVPPRFGIEIRTIAIEVFGCGIDRSLSGVKDQQSIVGYATEMRFGGERRSDGDARRGRTRLRFGERRLDVSIDETTMLAYRSDRPLNTGARDISP
ncbi:MAG TPA: hypothetical protein VGJ20_21260 [Xanthobacteraceae bacterium]|jgi:hypothetical protein